MLKRVVKSVILHEVTSFSYRTLFKYICLLKILVSCEKVLFVRVVCSLFQDFFFPILEFQH